MCKKIEHYEGADKKESEEEIIEDIDDLIFAGEFIKLHSEK